MFVGFVFGVIGFFIILCGMFLMGDVIFYVVFLGVVIFYMFGFSYIFGVIVFGMLIVVVIGFVI